ncbi:hypothetical protein [Oligoflexus tunisiensis]|uniref:hypothetical protein n=1 Tax=Oligoflexus tunisiensis TaxID=708132 RepID=UPI000AD7313A|nr:hypothetical protein [Oligoflexus tunisiensis]
MNRFFCEYPLVLIAVLLVAFNDHYLKQSDLAGLVTGKLSDFAGLFFFPFLLIDAISLIRPRWQQSEAVFLGCAGFTCLAFATLKTSATVVALYTALYAMCGVRVTVVRDPTDLFAIIMLPLAALFHRHLRGRFHASN